jgi:hypothetical protein
MYLADMLMVGRKRPPFINSLNMEVHQVRLDHKYI